MAGAHTRVEAALGVGEAAGPWGFETSQSAHSHVEAALGVQGVGEAGPPWPPDNLHHSASFQADRQQGEPSRQHVQAVHHGRLLRREGVLHLCRLLLLAAWAAACIAGAWGLAGDHRGLRALNAPFASNASPCTTITPPSRHPHTTTLTPPPHHPLTPPPHHPHATLTPPPSHHPLTTRNPPSHHPHTTLTPPSHHPHTTPRTTPRTTPKPPFICPLPPTPLYPTPPSLRLLPPLPDCADILAAGVALTPTTHTHSSAPPSSTSDSNNTSPIVDSTSPNSTSSSSRAGEWGHHRRYERREVECWSRAELPCYEGMSRHTQQQGKGEGNTDSSFSEAHAQVKLRQYHTYRRECLHREPLDLLRSTLLAGNPTSCRYLVFYHPSDGQGNRLISLVSAFAYALLTDRIFLLSSKSGPAAVLCEPFEHGESWVLFGREEKLEEHHAQVLRVKVAREWREVRQGREKMGKKGGGRRRLVEGLVQGGREGRWREQCLRVDIFHSTPSSGFLFFCESEQQWLSRTPTLLLSSNQYFLPALYLLPSFRRRLLLLFPSHQPFRSLARLLLFPRNRIWAQLTHRFHSLIAPAPARIGLQGRFPTHANEGRLRYDTVNMGRCLLDALNSSVLQEAREMRLVADWEEGGRGRGVVEGAGAAEGGELGRVFTSSGGSSSSSSGSDGSGDDYGLEGLSGNVTEVMVASLNAALVHNLSVAVTGNMSAVRVSVGHDATHAAMGVKLPPINTNAASPALPAAAPVPTSPDVANSSSSNGASDTHVHIVRLTIDEKQNNGDKAGVDRAMVDIYTLALFSDALVISEVSTFGYLCASLFGVPRTTFVSATCKRAPPEPCLHFPPGNKRCPDGQAQVLEQALAADPHVPLMHCVDVRNGLILKPLEGWE
ncbi:unnamed protein product [Closterium sp. Naga37s-1]|nr:unnamed protein product [Closterium sp. Naga37s-1]